MASQARSSVARRSPAANAPTAFTRASSLRWRAVTSSTSRRTLSPSVTSAWTPWRRSRAGRGARRGQRVEVARVAVRHDGGRAGLEGTQRDGLAQRPRAPRHQHHAVSHGGASWAALRPGDARAGRPGLPREPELRKGPVRPEALEADLDPGADRHALLRSGWKSGVTRFVTSRSAVVGPRLSPLLVQLDHHDRSRAPSPGSPAGSPAPRSRTSGSRRARSPRSTSRPARRTTGSPRRADSGVAGSPRIGGSRAGPSRAASK